MTFFGFLVTATDDWSSLFYILQVYWLHRTALTIFFTNMIEQNSLAPLFILIPIVVFSVFFLFRFNLAVA